MYKRQALEHYKKALDIDLPVLGEKHPSVATTYSNMGNVFDSKGDYDAALEHYKKARDIRLSAFGKKHPYTLRVSNNIRKIRQKMVS